MSSSEPSALEKVLHHPAIWRAEQVVHAAPGITTGWPSLDEALPDKGWPSAALTELLTNTPGIGELSLLTPALHAVAAEGRGIALLAPPFLPQARAWQGCGIALERLLIIEADGSELLWAAEQVLRSGECGAVLLWSQAAGRALNHRALQRLHLAASTGNAACFLYRAPSAQHHPSPAPLRLRLAAHQDVLHLDLVKSRGALHARTIVIQPFPAHWQATFTAAPASPARAASASPMSVRKKAVAVIQAHLLASAQVSLRASAQTSAQTKARSQGSSGAKPVSMDGEMLPRSSAAAIASLHDPLPFPTHIIEA